MSDSTLIVTWGLASGELPGQTEEALTFARKLGADVRLLALGAVGADAAAAAGRFGVTEIDAIDDAKLAEFSADAYVEALVQYCQAKSPRVVLFGQTFDARSIAPRVAGRLGAAIVMNVMDLEASGDGYLATCSAYGGDTRTVYNCAGAGTYLFAVNANAVVPEPSDAGASPASVGAFAADLSGSDERVRVLERAEAAEGPRLEHAQKIVAGGRGLGAADKFALVEELAAAIDGMAAASRPIVDDGWAKPAQQVGLTGKITKPGLYIAAGISGASQHMVGCTAAKTLVAINRDADAAIFRYAHFGIVGDCLEVLPELTRAVKS